MPLLAWLRNVCGVAALLAVCIIPALALERDTAEMPGDPAGGLQLSIAVTQSVPSRAPWPIAYLGLKNVGSSRIVIDSGSTEGNMSQAFRVHCARMPSHGNKRVHYEVEFTNPSGYIEGNQYIYPPIVLAPGQAQYLPNAILVTLEKLAAGDVCSIDAELVVRTVDDRAIPLRSGTVTFNVI